MYRNLAKPAGERDILIERDFLVAENQDLIFHKGVLDHTERSIAERLAQLHAGDFRGQMHAALYDSHTRV